MRRIAVVIAFALFGAGCASSPPDLRSRWEAVLAEDLPVGSPRERVEEVLKAHELEYSYADGTFYAMDRDAFRYRLLFRCSITMQIHIAETDTVSAYEVRQSCA